MSPRGLKFILFACGRDWVSPQRLRTPAAWHPCIHSLGSPLISLAWPPAWDGGHTGLEQDTQAQPLGRDILCQAEGRGAEGQGGGLVAQNLERASGGDAKGPLKSEGFHATGCGCEGGGQRRRASEGLGEGPGGLRVLPLQASDCSLGRAFLPAPRNPTT